MTDLTFFRRGAVLCRAGHHHHQVGRGLHLHPGGVRRAGCLPEALDRDAHHTAVLAVRGVPGVRQVPAQAHLPRLPCA